MSGTSNSMNSSVQIVVLKSIRMETEVVCTVDSHPVVSDTLQLCWDTDLQMEAGAKVIKSGIFVADYETEDESRWQIELNPNYINQFGDRYMSVYLVLVKTFKENAVITVSFDVTLTLPMEEYPTPKQDNDYTKSAGLIKFSAEKPTFGFATFIPFTKLGPLANPNNSEKLRFILSLNLIKDVPNLQPDEEAIIESDHDSTFASPPPFKQEDSPKFDSYLFHDGEYISVDSTRLNYYTDAFLKYLVKEKDKKIQERQKRKPPDFAKEIENRTLLRKIISFCYSGSVDMPKRWRGLCNVLEAAAKLGIVQLKKQCESEVLKRMEACNFTEVVDLTKINVLNANKAYPAIYEFMIANIDDLERENSYCQTFMQNKPFYEELILNCQSQNTEVDSVESELDELIKFYNDIPIVSSPNN